MSSVSKVERLLAQGNVNSLCRALRHRDSLVRRRAAQALGELGDPAGIPDLARALYTDTDQYVIRWSLESLQAIGDEVAIDVLVAAMFGSGRQIPRLAAQVLADMSVPQAAAALELRDILIRNDWDALASIGEQAQRSLSIVLQSEQYANWPSGKRKQILTIAARLGVTPLEEHSRELAEMGLFTSGVHTVGDLFKGLRHRNPEIRIAAAEKLGLSSQQWTTGALYRRFRHESRDGDRRVAVACARALSQLGDDRAIAHYKDRLYKTDGLQASEAARALAEIGTRETIDTLFWFAARPPQRPAYGNVPIALSALESASPAAIDTLRPLLTHEETTVRRLMVDVIARSCHTEAASWLGELGRDADPNVQRAALDALAVLNTASAAEALYALAGHAPSEWVIRALAAIAHPAGTRYLRELVPDATILYGTLKDEGQPLAKAHVQVIQEHFLGESAGWGWKATSGRATVDDAGAFALSIFDLDDDVTPRLKVTTPLRGDGTGNETFMADIRLLRGQANRVQARIDRLFTRLIVTVEPAETGR